MDNEVQPDKLYATTLQTIGAVAKLPVVRVDREAFLRKHFADSPHLNVILKSGPQAVYRPGKRHFVGWQAIDYARQRYGLPNGDYDRTRHQRQLVRSILGTALSEGLADNPDKLSNVIKALGDTLVYLGGRTPLEYAYALRDLAPGGITLVQLPGSGVGRGGSYLGEQLTAESKGFLQAVAKRQIAPYLAKHPKLINR